MKVSESGPWLGLLAAAALLGPPAAMSQYPTTYSDNSVAVVPDQAVNTFCQRYTVGGTQVRKALPGANSGGPLSGTGGASATYSLTGGTVLGFEAASPPIDFAVVRGKQGIKKAIAIHYYTGDGVEADGNIQVLDPANATNALPIVEFSLCSNAEDTEGTSSKAVTFNLTIPRCGEDDTPPLTDVCPDASDTDPITGSKEIVFIDFKPLRVETTTPSGTELLPAVFDAPLDPRSCFCTGGHPDVASLPTLVQCDDSLPANTDGGCTLNPAPGTKVELIGEQSNDPYFCRTVNGTRRCWEY